MTAALNHAYTVVSGVIAKINYCGAEIRCERHPTEHSKCCRDVQSVVLIELDFTGYNVSILHLTLPNVVIYGAL